MGPVKIIPQITNKLSVWPNAVEKWVEFLNWPFNQRLIMINGIYTIRCFGITIFVCITRALVCSTFDISHPDQTPHEDCGFVFPSKMLKYLSNLSAAHGQAKRDAPKYSG